MVQVPATATSPVLSQQFSTEAYSPRERVAAWREIYGHAITRLEFEPVAEAPFNIAASLRAFPGLSIASMATQGLRFSKPRSLIDSDDLILVLMEGGGYRGTQLGREVTLGPGDAVVRRNGEVTQGEIFGRPFIIRVPMKPIAERAGDVSAAIQKRIPADTDALRLLRGYVKAVEHDAGSAAAQHLAATHVHDLIALLLGASREAGRIASERGGRAARLNAIKADIGALLDREDFAIGMMASRHRITVRCLQKLFEHDGTSFSEYVLGERLARAHRLLSDPQRSHEKIASVAFECGFGDVSYFYKAFRRRFGMLPTDVRGAAQPTT
jgi:AraC-like DNA-binding protein